MSFRCIECTVIKHCEPCSGPNGLTCDICYSEQQKNQFSNNPTPLTLTESSLLKTLNQIAGLPYTCAACGAGFKDPIKLIEHLRQSHAVTPMQSYDWTLSMSDGSSIEMRFTRINPPVTFTR